MIKEWDVEIKKNELNNSKTIKSNMYDRHFKFYIVLLLLMLNINLLLSKLVSENLKSEENARIFALQNIQRYF